MTFWQQLAVTIISTLLASTGFWTYIQRRQEKNNASTEMLMGLGHDRIMSLGMECIKKGYVTPSEYENLHTYLYTPYKALNGNGSAKKIMTEVSKLPIKHGKEDRYLYETNKTN